MALIKPMIINPILPFNSTKDYTILFTVTSGSQIIANEVEVQRNSDNVQVYLRKKDSFVLQHNILANSLINSNEYRTRLRTYDVDNNFSNWSDWVYFWCFETPVDTITNITNGRINNQTYTFLGSHVHSDTLQSYKFFLYNENKSVVSYSPELFINLNQPQYEFAGLENDQLYYVELKTISIHQMEGTSGLVSFRPLYIAPKLNAVFTTENISDEGIIKLSADIRQIIGDIDSGSIQYIDGENIDLSNGKISFKTGFNLQSDFRLKVWGKNITIYEVFTKLNADNGVIELSIYNNAIHAFRRLSNCNLVSHYVSNTLVMNTGDNIVVEILQSNNMMDLKIAKVVI
jgi:hypothetical protein